MNPRYWRIFRWTFPRNDVRRYGAIPDSEKDCTAAIQRCIDKHGVAVLPAGVFHIMGTVTIDHEKSEVE